MSDIDSINNALQENENLPAAARSKEKKSVAQQLVEALQCFDFGVDTNDKPFAVAKGGHVTRSLRGDKRSVRKELGGLYYRMTGKTASQNALAEAMDMLECLATATEPVKLSLRVARPNDDEVYVDLGNQAEQVVRITPTVGRSSTATRTFPCFSDGPLSPSHCRPRGRAATSISSGPSSTPPATTIVR